MVSKLAKHIVHFKIKDWTFKVIWWFLQKSTWLRGRVICRCNALADYINICSSKALMFLTKIQKAIPTTFWRTAVPETILVTITIMLPYYFIFLSTLIQDWQHSKVAPVELLAKADWVNCTGLSKKPRAPTWGNWEFWCSSAYITPQEQQIFLICNVSLYAPQFLDLEQVHTELTNILRRQAVTATYVLQQIFFPLKWLSANLNILLRGLTEEDGFRQQRKQVIKEIWNRKVSERTAKDFKSA